MRLSRRALLGSLAAAPFAPAARAQVDYAAVRPRTPFSFPRDHGAHPLFRTEWWYVTGWLEADGRSFGFQVTFFRTRPPVGAENPSLFAPRQVLFAHAALSDPALGRLLHGERAARAGFGIAEAGQADADVRLQDWTFRREADRFVTAVATPEFALALAFTPTQPVFLQGENGYSRKGPKLEDASHYYSLPHLAVSGTVRHEDRDLAVSGEAWLDREWSSSYLAPNAAGWDWTGLNLADGSALMAFRIRARDGGTVWAGGSLRGPDGTAITRFEPADVAFRTVREWRSPHTQALYPVEQVLTVRLPEGSREFPLTPLFPDQELDSRASGLPVYWEGAVQTTEGRGYLELTGYAADLKM